MKQNPVHVCRIFSVILFLTKLRNYSSAQYDAHTTTHTHTQKHTYILTTNNARILTFTYNKQIFKLPDENKMQRTSRKKPEGRKIFE